MTEEGEAPQESLDDATKGSDDQGDNEEEMMEDEEPVDSAAGSSADIETVNDNATPCKYIMLI